ncbi:thiamine phosphate synthase [Sphingomonas changnyeongensis]|uniref:Thiamine phosphate synthase n=1 Tax=Sphingomonas changnyeongensis TaxID=2698679 RepID=A0A7Z2S748_9SPHN|nr:thiamine phosphate synthase [Sphingomonas changnyeongensis]QHL90031.1 thiamine phosphate synthase [Sphingomonas changnyeongensis]
MPERHRPLPRSRPLPRCWLLTDERQGAALWPALARLQRGAGVVVRHYGLDAGARGALITRIRALARRRGLTVVLAGPAEDAVRLRLDGVYQHPRRAHRQLIELATAHDRAELVAAARRGADQVLLSPVFATRSHPGAATLGPVRFGLLARHARLPVIALGGMTSDRARRLAALGAHGWAGIDGWGAQAR